MDLKHYCYVLMLLFIHEVRKIQSYLCLISISIIVLLSIFILSIFILEIHVIITFSTLWHVCNCCFIIILTIRHQLLFGFILYKIILGSNFHGESVILKGNLTARPSAQSLGDRIFHQIQIQMLILSFWNLRYFQKSMYFWVDWPIIQQADDIFTRVRFFSCAGSKRGL